MANAGLHLAFSIRILNAAWHGDRAVVSQHIAIERIQTGIVDIRCEHAFLQVVEHHDFGRAAQPPEGLFVQFGLQAVINMASSLELMPTKGMTLPFISYGGSSLLALGLGMGFLIALTRKRPHVALDPQSRPAL